MQEVNVNFKSKGKKVFGILSTPNNKTKSALIFANGYIDNVLTSYIVVNTARKMCEKGFAFLRFNARGRWPSYGKAIDMDLRDEVADLEAAIDFMIRKGFKKIGLIGHSLGGVDVIYAKKKNVKAIALLDPSDLQMIRKVVDKKMEAEIESRGFAYNPKWDFVIGRRMWNFWSKNSVSKEISELTVPTLIIVAGKGELIRYLRSFYRVLKCEKKLTVIEGAGHTFSILEHERRMLNELSDWFNKWLK